MLARAIFGAVLVWHCTSSGASAQEGSLDPDAEARALFEAGVYAFESERYTEALGHFERSYELSERPKLLYNIGLAAERIPDVARAIDAFESFLRALPDAENRADVEQRLEALRRSSAGDRDAAPAVEQDGGERIFTFVAAGAAVLFGAAAGISWWRAQDIYDDLEEDCLPNRCSDARIADSGGRTWQTVGNVAVAVAAAAGIAAVVLFFVEGGSASDSAEARVSIGPGSVLLEGRF